jgi:hypothetical protein
MKSNSAREKSPAHVLEVAQWDTVREYETATYDARFSNDMMEISSYLTSTPTNVP